MLYDSSTGIVYPMVDCMLNGGEMTSVIEFQDNAIYGSYDNPVTFVASELVQQRRDMNKGWNWMSLYLRPESGMKWDVSSVFEEDIMPYVEEVKEHNYFAKPTAEHDQLIGSLSSMEVGKMYKVRMNEAHTFSRIGMQVDLENTAQTIKPQWNWIGSLASYVMSPKQAFAELNPEKGDLVKNRTSFAEYNGYEWEGQLQEIKPGEGYLYLSKATTTKTFHYPKQSMAMLARSRGAFSEDETHWTVENINHYSDNMTVLATLEIDGEQIADAEVAAFIGGECRGTIKGMDGHYFLTILGISANDTHRPIVLKAWHNDREYNIADTGYFFVSDASYGSFSGGLVSLVTVPPVVGDANGDGKVDVSDIVAIMNKMLGTPQGSFNFTNADIDGDGEITDDDVKSVKEIIFSQTGQEK